MSGSRGGGGGVNKVINSLGVRDWWLAFDWYKEESDCSCMVHGYSII